MHNKSLIRVLGFYLPFFSFLIIAILFLLNSISKVNFLSFIYAIIISLLNFLIGFISINYGMTKNDKSFLLIVFGAIVVRFFIVFFMIISVLSFLDVRVDYFIFTTFILYFYYLIIEILYLKSLKNVEKTKE